MVGGLEGDDADAGGDGALGDAGPASTRPRPVDARPRGAVGAPRHRVAHGRVLDRGVHDHVARGASPAPARAGRRWTACGAAGGEGDLVGPYAQRVGRGLARVVEQQPCVAAGAVQPARVGVPPVERGQEHLARRRVQRRRGRAVEVGRPGRRGSHRGNLCHAQPRPRGRTDPTCADRPTPDPAPHDAVGWGYSLCVVKDRERGSSVGLQVPKLSGAPLQRTLRVALLGVTMLVLAGCSEADTAPDPQPGHARPGHRAGSLHLRALEVGLGRRHGDRRHRLGPDLLRRGEVPSPQRRRGPAADALQPAARGLLHDRAGPHVRRVLLPHRPRPGRGDQASTPTPT